MKDMEEQHRMAREAGNRKEREDLEGELERVREELLDVTEQHNNTLEEGEPKLPASPQDFSKAVEVTRYTLNMERYRIEEGKWLRKIARLEKRRGELFLELKELKRGEERILQRKLEEQYEKDKERVEAERIRTKECKKLKVYETEACGIFFPNTGPYAFWYKYSL
jgi:hypothetical protein